MVACFIHGKEQEVREFGATTRELLELADWLAKGECQMVAMESTASYWKPLYNILESSGLKCHGSERPSYEGGSGQEDGCKGFRMDC